jgi:pyrroloquinoline quinone biosynthesis protein D
MSPPALFNADSVIDMSPRFRFQWEEAQGCHVLLYPEGMIKLNQSAGAILKYCDGTRGFAAIVHALEQEFPGTELEADVREFLEVAHEQGWVHARAA